MNSACMVIGKSKLKVISQLPCKLNLLFHYKDSLHKKIALTLFADTLFKCVKQSAVSDHLLECNCSIDFDHFDILASDTNKFRLLIKESLLVDQRPAPVE